MAKVEDLYPGSNVTWVLRFRNALGALTTPTTTTISVRAPSGSISNPSVFNTSPGQMETSVNFNADGVWVLKAVATGTVQAVIFREVSVKPLVF